MNQSEYRIMDEKNNEFLVTFTDGKYEVKKIIDGFSYSEPTKEELEFVIKKLQEKLKSANSFNKDDALKTIISLIEENKITNYEELHNYINNLTISENDKYDLFEKSQGHLNTDTKEKSDIIKLKDELIDIIRKNKNPEITKELTFEVKSNISGPQLCNINFNIIDNGHTKPQKDITYYYTEELKKELIEPVLQELVLTSRAAQKVEPSDASFGYRSNFHLQTEENSYVHLNNIEQDYAYELQEDILSLNNSPKISDPYARDTKINEMKNEKELEENREKESELKRVKKKKMDDNKGFSSNIIIYLLVTLLTAFIFATQIIIFK